MDTQYILVLFSQIVKFLWHFGSVESIKKKQGSLRAVTIINSHVANTNKYLKIHRFIL